LEQAAPDVMGLDLALIKGLGPALLFAALFIAERLAPAVPAPLFQRRHLRNLGLWAAMAAASPLIGIPLSAAAASNVPWTRSSDIPAVLWFAADFLILDLWAFLAHRAYHAVPALWRLHAPHHLDEHLDATTALRFHPAEIVFSALIRMPLIMAFAVPLSHVLVFDSLLLAAAIFHHSNLRLPARLERAFSVIIVTPALHWVHHHARRADTDSNYGGVFSFWDALLRTRSPARRTPDMKIGVEGLSDRPLLRLFLLPFGAPTR
jgi:sterol desaturase/sphingolipid hydroxylase (fatty acid hydroxylase superfamily)